jgi:copper(I)-binding protein
MRGLIALLVLCVAGCNAPPPPLVASDVEVTRPMPGMKMSAGFFVLTNNTDADMRITGVTSPQFEAVEIHETRIEDGIARMRELDALVVPAHGSTTLARGGKHLMLMRPSDLGDIVSLQLMSGGVPLLQIDYSFPAEEEHAR